MTKSQDPEKIVREIKRKTRRRYTSEEKIRIVLEGLRVEDSIAEICRREGISPMSLPNIPSALVSLPLRQAEYSIFGCSKSSFAHSRPRSDRAGNSPLRTSLSAINSKSSSETPSGHGSSHLIGHFGPFSPEFSLIGNVI